MNIANPKDCFMAKFSGYSMKDAGILPNDLLLVDRKKEVSNGDIIVTAIKDGIVVKRLDKINGKLISENKDCKPIDITDQSDMHVWGVVIRVVREF
ncbi:MAG: S24 family peptidase [Pseudomonadota bacterium]